MKIKCLVIDDEPIAREGIADYIQRIPFLELIGACRNAFEASSFMASHPVDLLFLDIEMPDVNGIEFAQSLTQRPLIIFTTAYRDYAPEGFELDALDYLLKPISFPRFLKAANKALHQLEQQMPLETGADHFFIKSDGSYIKIAFRNILYLESAKDYVFIYTKERRYMSLISLKQVEQQLPADNFLRVHRSFIIAKNHVDSLEHHHLVIAERKIPISRSLQESVYTQLIEGKLWKRG